VVDATSGHVTSYVISGEVISDDVTSGKKNRFSDENENISKKYAKMIRGK